jgi:hypothetical protein
MTAAGLAVKSADGYCLAGHRPTLATAAFARHLDTPNPTKSAAPRNFPLSLPDPLQQAGSGTGKHIKFRDRRTHQTARCCSTASIRPALRNRKLINVPSCLGHRSLKSGHEAPSGFHAARARPLPPSEVLTEKIEQSLPVGGVQSAIRCRMGISKVQAPNQPRVFLDDDP